MEKKEQKNCLTCPAFQKSIFNEFTPNELNELAKNKIPLVVKKGQIIFYQGNKTLGVHCIREGKIKLSSITDDGRESIKNLLKEGQLVGHNNLIEKNDYQFSAIAIAESNLCQIDKDYFQNLLHTKADMTNKLLKKMCQEIHYLEERETTILYKNVKVRIAKLLLELIREFGIKEEEGIKLNLHLSRSEMASMIGIAGETLIRFLTELKETEIIKQQKKNIIFLKIEEIEKIANS